VTTWPTATAIIEGQALSLSTLSGGAASVDGSFAFTTPATTPPLGTAAQSVTFTPADAANYSTVVGSVNVTVNSAVVIRSAMQNGPWNDPATWGGTVPAAGDNVVIPAGFTVALNGDTAVLDNLTIAGTLTVPGTNTLKLSGNFTNTGTFTPGTGTVELTGSGDQMLVATAPGSLTFYCLTVNKAAATDKVTATSKLKVSRKLLITRGKLVSASDYADIEIGEDGELQLTGDITVSGNFINSGTLTTAGHGITFDGGVEQNLTLNYVTWFDDVTVATNTTLIETVTDDNALVNGTLLNQGVIRKTQPVTGVDTYYFGLAGNYGAGLAINVTALTGTDPLTAMQVDRIDANHPQAPGTNTTGIYWTITPTGSDYTASVTLPQAGLPAPMVCRYLASRWDWAQTSFDDTTVTRAGLTGFGDFAVFDNPQPIATTVTLGNLSQTWDGTAKAATATTSPANLTVTLTYDGSVNAPSDAGSYTVIGTVAEANYAGSATNTLVIAKAPATVTLGNLSQTYDGTAKSATASTTPDGLTVALTYNGSAAAPANAGNYRVIGTVVDASYAGSGTNILVIGQAGHVITFSPLAAVVYGDPPLTLSASASSGLPVSYASADTAIATVSGNTVTVLTAGSTVLTASQVGDANYLAATNVSQTLVVSDLLMGLSIQMQTNGVSHITTNHLGRLVTNYDYQPSLTVTGNLGRDYTIQYREDLTGTNWSVLTTLTNLPVSPYQVTDPATNPARFYRLRQP
jgi:hypothetical protein